MLKCFKEKHFRNELPADERVTKLDWIMKCAGETQTTTKSKAATKFDPKIKNPVRLDFRWLHSDHCKFPVKARLHFLLHVNSLFPELFTANFKMSGSACASSVRLSNWWPPHTCPWTIQLLHRTRLSLCALVYCLHPFPPFHSELLRLCGEVLLYQGRRCH